MRAISSAAPNALSSTMRWTIASMAAHVRRPGLGRTGVDRLGNTIQRTNNLDTNTQNGWAESLLPTWGANNSGQSNF